MLLTWQNVFPYEPTLAMTQFGVPSLIARFDGTLQGEAFEPYEIQVGCGWVGYAGVANTKFCAIRDEFAKHKWPQFKVVMPHTRKDQDDDLWLPRIDAREAFEDSGPLLVRYSAHSTKWKRLPASQQKALIARSLKPVVTQLDKRYGIVLGWWRPVGFAQTHQGNALPWNTSFVLKPLHGHGSHGVMIWNAAQREGRATRTQILNALEKNKWMYLQSFIPPMRMEIGGDDYNVIYRPFFGYDPQGKKWEPMHGVWTARPYPNLRIHGSSDALSGPLYIT